MLAVDRRQFIVPIPGLPANKTTMLLDYFFIDKTEVTNKDYKEFVDAGGYANPAYWKEAFVKNGQVIPWSEAVKAFVDRTGRPGPSTWELGDYSEDGDAYPVSGVSWFEAAAYARFRGKTLPTIYHWARAAFPIREISTPLTPHIIRQSNIEGAGLVRVGSSPGIGSSGAKDMAGNVREWCWNAVGGRIATARAACGRTRPICSTTALRRPPGTGPREMDFGAPYILRTLRFQKIS
jgi:formylglycine-generating enzyme required for sulfatase activity